MDSTVWRALARELEGRFRGARVARAHSPGPRTIELAIGDAQGTAVIVLSAEPGLPRIELRSRGPRIAAAERRGVLETHLAGSTLVAITVPEWERELRFEFERARLIARLVPNRAALVLVDRAGAPVAWWPAAAGASAAGPGVAAVGALAPLPRPANARTPDALDRPAIEDVLAREPAGRVDEKLRRATMGLSPAVIREIVYRAGLDGVTAPPLPAAGGLESLARAWGGLAALGDGGDPTSIPPCTWVHLPIHPLTRSGTRAHPEIALLELTHLARTHGARRFDSILAAAHAFARALRESREGENRERELRVALRRGREHETSLMGSLEDELEEAKSGPASRRCGELLVAHLALVRPGASSARVPDPYDPEAREVEVALDPSLSPEANVERYFRRARRAARALLEIPTRLEATGARLRDIEDIAARLEAAATWEEIASLHAEAHTHPALRARFVRSQAESSRAPAAEAADPVQKRLRNLAIRPRRIVLAPGWIALIGRTSRENDVLTTRAASPHDLWFHARGVAGSHVVVVRPSRHAEPPPEVIRRAANAAAWYSQGRTSSVTAVAWTEARYVRKPRGAAPGLVTLLREKVVMVEPSRPEGVSGDEGAGLDGAG